MRRQKGFSLIELVTVLVIVGIIAVYAAPKFTSQIFNVRASAGELADAIKYAQEMSMVHSGAANYQIELEANGYRVTQGGADITDPFNQSTPYRVSWDSVSLSQTGIISFDSRGQPTCSSGLSDCTGPSDSDLNVILTTGSDSVIVTVARLTGYAYVQ